MNSARCALTLVTPCFLLLGNLPTSAQSVVVVPPERTSSLANNEDDAPLGNVDQHFQQIYSSSLLTGINVGDQITGLGFRVTAGQTDVPTQVVPNYRIWLGQSAVAPSAMSLTFADNRGAGFTQVRSGALNITPGLFVGGPGVNPIGMIDFSTPFTYTGGNLLIEISYDTFPAGGRNAESESPYNQSLAAAAFGNGANSTTAFAVYDEALVIGLRVVPAPEPSMALPLLGGLAYLIYRRK